MEAWFGRRIDVEIEVCAGGFLKRKPGGGLDYISPLPAPFAYGSVVGEEGGDGDPLDAIVLGWPGRAGERVEVGVVGVVRFIDRGLRDDKLVTHPLGVIGPAERRRVERFFVWYPTFRRWLDRFRGRGRTDVRVESVSWAG